MTDTMTRTDVVEQFLRAAPYPRLSISVDGKTFYANSYWPDGDSLRGAFCHGAGPTIDAALEKLAQKWAAAEASGKKLRTAAECKAAVIDLIAAHDAAPASFRDAVDALPVL